MYGDFNQQTILENVKKAYQIVQPTNDLSDEGLLGLISLFVGKGQQRQYVIDQLSLLPRYAHVVKVLSNDK